MRLHSNAAIRPATQSVAPVKLEPAVARRVRDRRSVSRAVYLLLLAVLAVLGLKALGGRLLFYSVPGVIELGETSVASERAGRLTRILTSPGAAVTRGQPVAVVTVQQEEAAAARAREDVRRLRAEIEGERLRSLARSRIQATDHRAEASRLRDRQISARADLAQIDKEIESLDRQLQEIDQELEAQQQLVRAEVMARSGTLDLRLRRHEVVGRREGLAQRQEWLQTTAKQLAEAARALEQRVRGAKADALEASLMASLEARLEEAKAAVELHESLARLGVKAPVGGTVSWVHRREGETLAQGEPILRIVPQRPATVVAYPSQHVSAFATGTRVRLEAADFEALGTVDQVLIADRQKPLALLRPYERESIGPAVIIRIEECLEGVPRAGGMVMVSRPRADLLARLLNGKGNARAPSVASH